MIGADAPLRYLKGVGPGRGEKLAAAGCETVEDLLYLKPFRWEDRRSFAQVGELAVGGPERTLAVTVESARLIRTRRRGFTIFEAVVADASGPARAVWYNQPYLERAVRAGRHAVLFGRLVADRYGKPVLEGPEIEFIDGDDEGIHAGRIVPVYRKLADLGSRALRRLVHLALAEVDPASLAPLVPPEVARRHGFPDRLEALRAVHFPPADVSLGDLAAGRTTAQQALAFEEVYLVQLGLGLRRHGLRQERRGIAYEVTDALRTRLGAMLPFKLTGAQRRVLAEIGADLRSERPMNRLLQGDVGSGKTVVALLALLVAVHNGYQAALMAPTEILADQHARNIARLLKRGGIDCRLAVLTGSLRSVARRTALETIADGRAQLVIGTHALFERGVAFHRLGLVVIDEQHRFGVLQRAALTGKGTQPDVLVMTATPIPRSLALTLYGDLDLSVLDELPPGRTPIRTVVRRESERERVWTGLRGEVARGRQAYVVVPLVEESEKVDLKAAEAFAEQLRREVFPDLRVGMLHGRMKPGEKDAVMGEFVAGTIPILVATTVIEVGVDVPNATVMIVEHAERFGLSQLHQLRGRVGRGSERSYCVLMLGEGGAGDEARRRLATLESTSDGFLVAERDLELRGPGAVFGTAQHGLSDLQFLVEALRAPGLIEAARDEAQAALATGDAAREGARALLARLGGRWRRRLELAQVG